MTSTDTVDESVSVPLTSAVEIEPGKIQTDVITCQPVKARENQKDGDRNIQSENNMNECCLCPLDLCTFCAHCMDIIVTCFAACCYENCLCECLTGTCEACQICLECCAACGSA